MCKGGVGGSLTVVFYVCVKIINQKPTNKRLQNDRTKMIINERLIALIKTEIKANIVRCYWRQVNNMGRLQRLTASLPPYCGPTGSWLLYLDPCPPTVLTGNERRSPRPGSPYRLIRCGLRRAARKRTRTVVISVFVPFTESYSFNRSIIMALFLEFQKVDQSQLPQMYVNYNSRDN